VEENITKAISKSKNIICLSNTGDSITNVPNPSTGEWVSSSDQSCTVHAPYIFGLWCTHCRKQLHRPLLWV